MLKRSPSLTEQAKFHIKQRIINAEFEAGRIPSETDLASELGVSRTTIRDALSRLELEGVIYRRQGAGTFVNEVGLQIKTRLEEIWAYEAMLEAHGYTPSTRIISVAEQPAPADIASELQLDAHAPVLQITKLFLADNKPVILTRNSMAPSIILRPYIKEDFHLPMYQFLPEFCQQHLAYYVGEIVPLIAPDWLVELLELPERKAALLSFEEVGYNQDNAPIITAQSFFRDDVLRLRLMRRPA
ncbi:MAG TPA: GntR family transcriptional regulator [Anaerolineae bacterium]